MEIVLEISVPVNKAREVDPGDPLDPVDQPVTPITRSVCEINPLDNFVTLFNWI